MKFTKRELPESDGGKFLKFKDGESKTGVFRGEVFEFYARWENGRTVVCDPHDGGKDFVNCFFHGRSLKKETRGPSNAAP